MMLNYIALFSGSTVVYSWLSARREVFTSRIGPAQGSGKRSQNADGCKCIEGFRPFRDPSLEEASQCNCEKFRVWQADTFRLPHSLEMPFKV